MNNLKILRARKGYSLRELAKKIGISAVAINNIENGKVKIADKRIESFCDALECTPEELIGDQKSDYKSVNYRIKDEYVQQSMQIVDHINKNFDLSTEERSRYLMDVYKIIYDLYENNPEKLSLETRVLNLRKKFEEELILKENIIDFLEQNHD